MIVPETRSIFIVSSACRLVIRTSAGSAPEPSLFLSHFSVHAPPVYGPFGGGPGHCSIGPWFPLKLMAFMLGGGGGVSHSPVPALQVVPSEQGQSASHAGVHMPLLVVISPAGHEDVHVPSSQ